MQVYPFDYGVSDFSWLGGVHVSVTQLVFLQKSVIFSCATDAKEPLSGTLFPIRTLRRTRGRDKGKLNYRFLLFSLVVLEKDFIFVKKLINRKMETKTSKRQRERTINLSLNRRQVIDVFRFMDEQDREYIYNELKKILFLSKVNNLRNSFFNSELTMDDITEEVEAVRKERYETGRQIID